MSGNLSSMVVGVDDDEVCRRCSNAKAPHATSDQAVQLNDSPGLVGTSQLGQTSRNIEGINSLHKDESLADHLCHVILGH
jgi:hypothetical protein